MMKMKMMVDDVGDNYNKDNNNDSSDSERGRGDDSRQYKKQFAQKGKYIYKQM